MVSIGMCLLINQKQTSLPLAEGDYPDGLLVVRAGFARVSQKFENGQKTITYLVRVTCSA